MSKEIRKELKKCGEQFKYEPDITKKKVRDLYKLCVKACDLVDLLRSEIAAYKAPKLYAEESNQIPKRVYLSRYERIQGFLKTDPECKTEAFQNFLKWNRLSLQDVKSLVDPESKTE